MRTLKQWEDDESVNVLRFLDEQTVRVDHVPSLWFAPQVVRLPDDVMPSTDEVRAYDPANEGKCE